MHVYIFFYLSAAYSHNTYNNSFNNTFSGLTKPALEAAHTQWRPQGKYALISYTCFYLFF